MNVFSAQAPNPRESNQKAVGRAGVPTVSVARRVSGNVRSGITSPGANATRVSRAGRIPSATNTRNGAMTRVFSRNATVSRAASPARSAARSGKKTVSGSAGMARSALSRATAIFNDVSKIGSGYAACRESYSTCMDQMCAAANDTYRRCFCSERFVKFRDTEQSLDQAMAMLRQFEDNNLNAVDKTAAEVSAMYSATVGEQAIKKDTSAAAQVLDSIGDLLSGKIPANSKTLNELGGIDFSSDLGDIWGSDASSSIFAPSKEKDMSELEGAALFSSAQQQCVRLTQSQCENDAVFNMAKSSYNILITQDCNLYEKTLNKKRENVEDAVRQAEKILRDARLEEYRSHNSADVNECIDKVRTAMLQDTACGADYKRCLDPTGAYVSAATGEPIYSVRLLKLEELINLNGDVKGDVLNQNQTYNTYLDGYRPRAAKALDTCRDNADYVWTEFKRAAIIEIAQAQSAMVEEVKSNCVSVIAECYNSQTGQLNSFDTTESKAAGAIGRYAAAGMCKEKVNACAALYGNGKCEFDNRGKLKNSSSQAMKDNGCGLEALLDFVSNVDDAKVSELCETALNNYLKEICTPSTGEEGYPWNCRTQDETELGEKLRTFATTNCKEPGKNGIDSERVNGKIDKVLADLSEEIIYALSEKCSEMDGYWYGKESLGDKCSVKDDAAATPLPGFFSEVFGNKNTATGSCYWGTCVEDTDRMKCLAFNSEGKKVASWNGGRMDCDFTEAWYNERCELIGGYYEVETCYVPQQ